MTFVDTMQIIKIDETQTLIDLEWCES